MKITSGPAIERSGDLAAMLSNLAPGDVLFIDEIHRIARPAEELLYMAMEDFRVDVVVGKGPGATAIPLEISPFTLVGATTRAGLLTGPLRDRFGFVGQMEFYEPAELQQVLAPQRRPARRRAHRGRLRGDRRPLARHPAHRQPAAAPGARLRRGRGRRPGDPRGRPGRAGALRRRRTSAWTGSTARCWRRWSSASAAGRSASPPWPSPWGRSRNTVEEVCEPFLVRAGLLARTPRGRVATEAAWRHLGHPLPRGGALLSGAGRAQRQTGAPATPGASSEPLFGA